MPDIASNDIRAQAAMTAVQAVGLSVPGDVSIVGCDDIEMGRFLTPSLTTIRQSDEPISRTGVEMLLEMIQNPKLPARHIMLESNLVVRQSTGTATVCRNLHG